MYVQTFFKKGNTIQGGTLFKKEIWYFCKRMKIYLSCLDLGAEKKEVQTMHRYPNKILQRPRNHPRNRPRISMNLGRTFT